MKYIVLCTFWILWCFLHSLFTATGVTGWLKGRLGDKFAFYRIFYNFLSLITILPLLSWQWTLGGPVVIKLSPFLMIFKYAALLFSAVVVAGSFFTFDVGEFAGIKQLQKRQRRTRDTTVISRHGFYGVVRHPMYLGGFVFLVALMMHAPLAQFLGYGILAVYMVLGTLHEDRRLARELGEVYREYQKEVPMFLPNIMSK